MGCGAFSTELQVPPSSLLYCCSVPFSVSKLTNSVNMNLGNTDSEGQEAGNCSHQLPREFGHDLATEQQLQLTELHRCYYFMLVQLKNNKIKYCNFLHSFLKLFLFIGQFSNTYLSPSL